MKTAKEIHAFFLDSTPPQRLSYINTLPPLQRQMVANQCASLDDVALSVQALEIIADDLLMLADERARIHAEAAYTTSRELYERGAQPQDALLQVHTRSALSVMRASMNEGDFEPARELAEQTIVWVQSLGHRSEPVAQNLASIRMKIAESFADEGYFDRAAVSLEAVDQTVFNAALRMTYDTLHKRITDQGGGVVGGPGPTVDDLKQLVGQLEALRPMVRSFESMGWVGRGTGNRIDTLVQRASEASTLDASFAGEVVSLVKEIQACIGRDPNAR